MNCACIELTASDWNARIGGTVLSSQGSSGHNTPFGVSNYATDNVLFSCDFEPAVIRYFLLLVIACYFFLLFLSYCCYSLRFVVLLCGDVETNTGPQSKCRTLYHNIKTPMRNL